jgi:5-deoxy-5-amino-3-dehydroquinate synthase
MRRLTVALERPYEVLVGPGALHRLGGLIAPYRRAAIVSQGPIVTALGTELLEADVIGPEPWIVTMGDGEGAKTLASVEALGGALARGGLLRDDVVVALGGGVVGDTAGLVAALYHRGVDVVQVPTSLLAQVDAAIGGKTAVNLPEGKNLIGAFHQPIGVVADTRVLASLPAAEFRSGLGEVAKYALMPDGGAVVDLLRIRTDAVLARDPAALAELVAACVAIKARVVAADPRERSGSRAILNYGHTLAHALETTAGYTLAHGEAVAIGLIFAANLARALERVGPDIVDRVHGVVASLELPVQVPADVDRVELLEAMRRDKKSKGGLTFVLPGANGLELVDDPPARALDVAFAAVGA